jgi:two-component system nitrogen regulation response regulator NtrX
MKSRILVIDDEAAIRDSLRMILEYEGYEFLGAATGEEGIGVVEREAVDLVFLDIKMPGMDGLEVLGRLKKVAESLPVVMISGHATVATAVEATKMGAFDFIEKPLATERVLLTIRNALGFTQLRDEHQLLLLKYGVRSDMVGASPVLNEVLESVRRAAPTSATVLIRGESGSGKELVVHSGELRRHP